VVISPDEMNRHLCTVIVAPLTSRDRLYPTRVHCHFDGREGLVVLDQIRTIDVARLVKKVGRVEPATLKAILTVLGRADLRRVGPWRRRPSFRRLRARPEESPAFTGARC
jgi:mRNA-degrading endonuclease toxin of MazEF toxin-antitoxin module